MGRASALAKFLAKTPELSKEAQMLHGKRIDALQAVREAVKKMKSGNANIERGAYADTVLFGDKAVKIPGERSDWRTSKSPEGIAKQFKRRAFLESRAHDAGIAPETHLVETQRQKYLVQPKADFEGRKLVQGEKRAAVQDWFDRNNGPELVSDYTNPKSLDAQNTAAARYLRGKAMDDGLSGTDLSYGNMGWFKGKPKMFDFGENYLVDDEKMMTPKDTDAALRRIISFAKGKRTQG
jgi:hypothetical protein